MTTTKLTQNAQTPVNLIEPDALSLSDTVEVPRLLRPDDVAGYLGVSERTLERWRMTGEGPTFVRLSANRVRYMAVHLRDFLSDRIRRSTAQ